MTADGSLELTLAQSIALFKYFVYLPLCLLCYWQLVSRLSNSVKRVATITLILQVLVLLMATEVPSRTSYWGVVWHFDMEHNIPSAMASTLLAFAGAVSLVTAWRARERLYWLRLHWVLIGLILLLMGLDEYFEPYKKYLLQTYSANWHIGYIIIGMAAAGSTAMAWLRAQRLWHGCMLAALLFFALGGIVLDPTQFCGLEGVLQVTVNECEGLFAIEELSEQFGTWLALAAALGHLGTLRGPLSPRLRRMLWAVPLLWLLLIPVNSLVSRLELHFLGDKAAASFDGGVQLHGYQLEESDVGVNIRAYFRASQANYARASDYFVDFVDQASLESVRKLPARVDRLHGLWFMGPQFVPVYRQSFWVRFTENLLPNRAFWITLALADHGGLLHAQSQDLPLLGGRQLILGEIVIQAPQPQPSAAPIARFDGRFALMNVTFPERAQAGDALEIPITWYSSAVGERDYSQFLHFVHAESGLQWGYDQPPLGDRLPTRLWYEGLVDTETWQVTLSSDLASGQYDVFTGLYNSRDMQRLPTIDAAGVPILDARVRLGSLLIDA